jgi:hypothetical protein
MLDSKENIVKFVAGARHDGEIRTSGALTYRVN